MNRAKGRRRRQTTVSKNDIISHASPFFSSVLETGRDPDHMVTHGVHHRTGKSSSVDAQFSSVRNVIVSFQFWIIALIAVGIWLK